LLLVQVATGLIADDEIATTGPLNRFVSAATAGTASGWHAKFGKTLLIVLVSQHVAAVLFYLWKKKRNLIPPMIHGDMLLPAVSPASADGPPRRLLALAIVLVTSALAWWIGSLGA
jgi:cytochrome b